MRSTAARTQASEEWLRQAMAGPRLMRNALGLGSKYDQYLNAFHDECMASACASDWAFVQRLSAAGFRNAAEQVDEAARSRSARAGRPVEASRIALDANLMLAVDARRFLCVMQEMTGGHIWITEQVWRETWGRCKRIDCTKSPAASPSTCKDRIHRRWQQHYGNLGRHASRRTRVQPAGKREALRGAPAPAKTVA